MRPPLHPITTDRGALHRVLRNLVVNAIEAAQRLVQQMGGTLTATSIVGTGTQCVVDLPRSTETGPAIGAATGPVAP